MPFLTEELWHQLPQREGARSIALDRFPQPRTDQIDADAEALVTLLQEIITTARNIRAEMKLDQKAKLAAQLAPANSRVCSAAEQELGTILRLANVSGLSFAKPPFDSTKGIVRSATDFDLFVPYPEPSFDVQAEVSKLRKERDRLTKDIALKEQRLADETFRSRAPAHIVKGLEVTLAERRAEFEKAKDRLAQLEKSLGEGS
jgi:valyl-tRNA synthetase